MKKTWVIDGKEVELFEEIRSGRKTSEWRDAFNDKGSENRSLLPLVTRKAWGLVRLADGSQIDLSGFVKRNRVWFVVGYPKNNLPRLEADIRQVLYHGDTQQFEIKFANVEEVGMMRECMRQLVLSQRRLEK